MLAAARDSKHVEQLKVIGVDGVDEALGGALGIVELAPLVEARLCGTAHLSNRLNTLSIRQIRIIALGDELNLVA